MSHLGYLNGRSRGRIVGLGAWGRLRTALHPPTLSSLTLRGARSAAAVRLVIANDVSGSMSEFAAAREAAIDALVAWAPANLRPTDEIGVIEFAEEARWTLRPATVHHLALMGAVRESTGLAGGGTALLPVVDRVCNLGAHPGRLSVWLLSDGEYPDYPSSVEAGRRLLQDAGVDSLPLLIPSRAAHAPTEWRDTFPDEASLSFDGLDPEATALAFALALAGVTGQRLVRAS